MHQQIPPQRPSLTVGLNSQNNGNNNTTSQVTNNQNTTMSPATMREQCNRSEGSNGGHHSTSQYHFQSSEGSVTMWGQNGNRSSGNVYSIRPPTTTNEHHQQYHIPIVTPMHQQQVTTNTPLNTGMVGITM